MATYWQRELRNVTTVSPDGEEYSGAKLKITGNGGMHATRWLSLTPQQFEALKAFMLSIEEDGEL